MVHLQFDATAKTPYITGYYNDAGGMAEKQGFEPWEPVKAQRFSRPSRSTTPALLHDIFNPHLGGIGRRSKTEICAIRCGGEMFDTVQ